MSKKIKPDVEQIIGTLNNKKSRRDFLKYAGTSSLILSTVGLTACSGGSGNTTSNSSGNPSVLVLGAGAAGLAAGIALKKQGHNVTMLEYQNRVGGRLWSKELLGGQFTELGAGHFANDGMPLVNALVDRYQLPRLEVYDGTPRYVMRDIDVNNINSYQGDSSSPSAWPLQWGLNEDERLTPIGPTLIRYLNRAGITNLDAALDASWPTAAAVTTYGNMTVKQLLQDQGASQGFINLLNVHLGSFAADGDVLDGLSSLTYFFYKKVFFRVQGGNERIAKAMADEFGRSNIHLNSIVVGIDQTGSQVKVTTSDGRTFSADKIVSTIPFKVLTDVNVQPHWSAGKTRLFSPSEGLKWIDGFKGVIQTGTPTWVTQGNLGWPMATTDQAWNRFIDITGTESGGYGNGFFYVYREEKLAQLKAITGPNKIRDRANLLLNQFNSTPGYTPTSGFTNNLINLNDIVLRDSIMWADGEDVPWIKSALGVGVKPWMRDEWSTPEGNIHFAGDFTSYKSGWVEGALESGLRAATEINAKATYF